MLTVNSILGSNDMNREVNQLIDVESLLENTSINIMSDQ
jgi:hypothetical protein